MKSLLDKTQPLWLPQGSVRALLAFLIVTPIIFIATKSNVTLTGDQINGLITLVVGFYFISKVGSDSGQAPGA